MATLLAIAKALAAALAAGIAALLLVITGNEGLTDVTTAEWLIVILSILGSFGVTWAVPNTPKTG